MYPLPMKILSRSLCVATCLLASSHLLAKGIGYVVYSGNASPGRIVEGPGPLTEPFTLNVTSPETLPARSYTVGFQIAVTSMPANATTADALSYVSISPATIQFTGPSQTQTVTETVSFPAGAVVGSYAYLITTSWPEISGYTLIDNGVYITMTVDPPQSTPSAPSILINTPAANSVWTYVAGGSPLQISFSFTATTASTDPVIMKVDADVSGTALAVTASGLGISQVTGSGTIQVSAAGIYTLNTRAYNTAGTGQSSVDFAVNVTGSPPTVTILFPAKNASYSYFAGGAGVTVPISISATSAYGGVQTMSATLNGSPIVLSVQGLGLATATASASVQVSAAGSYTLAASATDALGTTTASSSFTVTAQQPVPVITISQPASGSGPYTLPTGGGSVSIPYAFTANVAYGNIGSLGVSLNGTPQSGSVSGVGTPAATGNGTIQITASGSYTLSVTATSNGVSATASTSFTVNQAVSPPPQCSVLWLPPVSLGKPFQGGSTVPIAFSIVNSKGKFVRDQSVVIAVSKDGADSELFTYGPASDHNDDTYKIVLFAYALNYDTNRGVHTYRIDVYNFWPAGSDNPNLLGTKTITTKGRNDGHGDDHDGHGDDHDGHGDDHDGHGDDHDGHGNGH
jgi:hypothetical protein